MTRLPHLRVSLSALAHGWIRFLRALRRRSSLLRLFLVGLLLLAGLGATGLVQNLLGDMTGGQTALAYAVASQRHGASLQAMAEVPNYELVTTEDTFLQAYFDLDPHQGALRLRDGLQSIHPQMNPLSVFPIRIRELSASGVEKQASRLFIHVVDCPTFLQLEAESRQLREASPLGVPSALVSAAPGPVAQPATWTGRVSLANRNEVERDAACAAVEPPLLRGTTTMGRISQWMIWKARTESVSGGAAAAAPTPSAVVEQPTGPRDKPAAMRQDLLRAQLQTYRDELREVLADPPQPGRSQSVEADPAVEELVILRDRADPGLLVFSPELPQAGSGLRKPQAVLGVEVSDQHEDLALAGDQLLITALRVRGPVLLLLGVIAPLLAFLLRFRHRIVRLTLQPYLLLVAAQLATMLLAGALMGSGLVLWVGFLFTLLRLAQLCGLLALAQAVARHRLPEARLRRQPWWLRPLLVAELLLWGANGLGLGWHIVSVLRSFPYISPA